VKVIVAMSGGVDSSVAAALLKKEGYQVTGITMQIQPSDELRHRDRSGDSCGISAAEDARKVSHELSIPHHVMDFRDAFARKVIANFCEEYSMGRTPNPCIRCNRYLKFGVLLEEAKRLGADFIATGHHARIEKDEIRGIYLLKKGVDQSKDQSYMLYALTQEQLRHTLLPIGNYTKKKVREIARELQLPVADREESQDICFIPDNDYASFLKDYIPQAVKPGPILDEQENILGRHHGILFYTIGQRRGLGISAGEPLYITAIEPERNAIVAGTREQAQGDELIVSGVNWISIAKLTQPLTVKAKIRYRHQEAEATVTPFAENSLYVKFTEPQLAITPGQAIVFYDGDIVLGGGTIESIKNPRNRVEIGEAVS